jgi:acetolactate synthase-1/2/3 large subunit
VHAAIDPAAMVRDFVKWDDQPTSLQHFAESAVRAYKVATTPPMAPVMLSLDACRKIRLQTATRCTSRGLQG